MFDLNLHHRVDGIGQTAGGLGMHVFVAVRFAPNGTTGLSDECTQTEQDQCAAGHCVARLHHQGLAGPGQEQYALRPFVLPLTIHFLSFFWLHTTIAPGKVYECADAKDDRFAIKVQRHHHKAKLPGAEFGSALEKEGYLLRQMQGECVCFGVWQITTTTNVTVGADSPHACRFVAEFHTEIDGAKIQCLVMQKVSCSCVRRRALLLL